MSPKLTKNRLTITVRVVDAKDGLLWDANADIEPGATVMDVTNAVAECATKVKRQYQGNEFVRPMLGPLYGPGRHAFLDALSRTPQLPPPYGQLEIHCCGRTCNGTSTCTCSCKGCIAEERRAMDTEPSIDAPWLFYCGACSANGTSPEKLTACPVCFVDFDKWEGPGVEVKVDERVAMPVTRYCVCAEIEMVEGKCIICGGRSREILPLRVSLGIGPGPALEPLERPAEPRDICKRCAGSGWTYASTDQEDARTRSCSGCNGEGTVSRVQ